MGQPLISVGLQFFNNADTIGSAVASILRQTYQNWELIIHDDGSTDGGLAIVERINDPRIKIFTDSTNKKRPIRLNESLDVARGKYYAVMDGDDIAYPCRLERQVAFLEAHPSIDLLGAGMLVFDHQGRALGKRQLPTEHEQICRRPWMGFAIAQPTFMGKKAWFTSHYYDPRATGGVEDQDLLLRTHASSRFANLPEILMGYREKDIYIRKIANSRLNFCRSLQRNWSSQTGRLRLGLAVFVQCLKLGVDYTAVTSGLKYRLLSHRAQPLSSLELQEWLRLWGAIQ